MEELQKYLDEIATYLAEGEAWHRTAANECRKLFVRGWGRWHEAEAQCDEKSQICLAKLARDMLQYAPVIDSSFLVRANAYTIKDLDAFKLHHNQWIEREQMLIMALNNAIEQSRAIDIKVYHFLCDLAEEVQNEKMRVELVKGRMGLSAWNGHDIGVVSMVLHKYFECEYKGGEIDFNIG